MRTMFGGFTPYSYADVMRETQWNRRRIGPGVFDPHKGVVRFQHWLRNTGNYPGSVRRKMKKEN
jgi:hypothetical protein